MPAFFACLMMKIKATFLSQNMNKTSLRIVTILCALSMSFFATAHEKAPQNISGQIRLGYINSDDDMGNKNDTLAIGGKLGYKSPAHQGFSVGGTFYTTNAIGGINDEAIFLASDKSNYSILGEVYVNADFGTTNIKVGRQEIDTPFADTDDIGMIPNTFEGLFISKQATKNTTLLFSHLHRQAGFDAATPEKFSKINGSKGVNVIGLLYDPSEQWNLQAWHYNAKNSTDISYLETAINPIDNFNIGMQYSTQEGSGFNGKVWGLSAEYALGNITLSVAHNKVSNGQIKNGFGGGPFFTSAEDHTIAEVNHQKATAIGIEYTLNKLTLAAAQVNFDQGENEIDVLTAYHFNDKLSAELIYSGLHNDGTLSRAFINYNF
jgi:predicted porin